MNIQPSEKLQEALKRVAAIYPGDAGLFEEIEEVRARLAQLPREFRFTFHLNPSPSTFGPNQGDVFIGLLRQVEGWVGFFTYSVVFRLLQLLDDIVTGLNEARYLRTASDLAAAAF